MGKQVNFYLLEEDESDLVAFVLSHPDAVILGDPSTQDSPSILEHLPTGDAPIPYRGTVYLWKRGGPLLMTRHTIIAGPLVGRELYFVDSLRSHVIELARTHLLEEEGLIIRGRLWAEMRYWEGEILMYKGEAFEKWYDRLARWIRTHYQKVADHRPYIGPQACRLYQKGIKLR